jgi:heme exporter protein A
VETDTEPSIEVKGLTMTFGHVKALKGIDLRLHTGEFMTIFGPNGAGKTTLIKILSALLRPTSGVVRITGRELPKESDEIRKKIGLLSHNSFLYANLSARENLDFYSRIYGMKRAGERIGAVLDEVGLTPKRDDLVKTYSRGMVQRLAIARTILLEPEIIFLDEPYTGLDQHAAVTLRKILARLHDGRRSIILTTHNIARGLELCDSVVIQVSGVTVYNDSSSSIDKGDFEALYFKNVEDN